MIVSCSPGFADVFRYHNHVLSLMGSCSTARAKSVASGGHPERPPRPLARPHAAPAGRHRHPNHAPNAPDGGDARGAAPAPASPPQARPTALPGHKTQKTQKKQRSKQARRETHRSKESKKQGASCIAANAQAQNKKQDAWNNEARRNGSKPKDANVTSGEGGGGDAAATTAIPAHGQRMPRTKRRLRED